jgi:hypothetical protein
MDMSLACGALLLGFNIARVSGTPLAGPKGPRRSRCCQSIFWVARIHVEHICFRFYVSRTSMRQFGVLVTMAEMILTHLLVETAVVECFFSSPSLSRN